MNRCAHKGTRLVSAPCGKSSGGLLRCPYHGWTYRLDGTLRSRAAKSGYEGTRLHEREAAQGPARTVHYVQLPRLRVRTLDAKGPDFEEYFGDSLSSIDNMVDRSPEGRLEVAGGVLRYLHDCNWKMFVENLNDTMHPMVAHESSAGTAKRPVESASRPRRPKPMAIEQFVPFVNDYEFFEKMGVQRLSTTATATRA